MKLCPDCLSNYKNSKIGKLEKKINGKWGKNNWPLKIYHNEISRKCKNHHIDSIHNSSTRRGKLKNSIPSWVDMKAIKDIYRQCTELNNLSKEKFEVDHIIPLSGKNVCGFHIHTNLQIIKASENRKKSNSFVL
jgi:hypothetical protein